jgi:hypothetical protein
VGGIGGFVEAVSLMTAHLDVQMLLSRSVKIHDEITPDDALPECFDLDQQLGGRLLIKYVRSDSVSYFSKLSGVANFPGVHYATPSPIAARDLQSALNLPPLRLPQYALLLAPERLSKVVGPRRISGGIGVEYLLLDGFSVDAIVPPGWSMEYK